MRVVLRLIRLWPVDSLTAPFTPDGVEGRYFFVLGNVRTPVQSLDTSRGHLAANRGAHRSTESRHLEHSTVFDARLTRNSKVSSLVVKSLAGASAQPSSSSPLGLKAFLKLQDFKLDCGENSEPGAKLPLTQPRPGLASFATHAGVRQHSPSLDRGVESSSRASRSTQSPQHSQTFKAIAHLAVAPLADSQGRVLDLPLDA